MADVFKALTSSRPYRAELTPSVALGLIRPDAGVEPCPRAVEELVAMVDESPKQMAG